jgi:hypothetical protein
MRQNTSNNQTQEFGQPQELVCCLQIPNSHTYVSLNSFWIKLKKLVVDYYPATTGVATAIKPKHPRIQNPKCKEPKTLKPNGQHKTRSLHP